MSRDMIHARPLLVAMCLGLGCAGARLDPLASTHVTSASPARASTVDAESPRGSTAVWKPSSARIEISSFSFWNGSSGYAKDRADMTPEQLRALEGLRTIPAREGVRVYDAPSHRIGVFDEDGSVERYRAALRNMRDSDESAEALHWPTIDIETLTPFLETFECLHAKQVPSIPRTTDAPAAPASVDEAKATPLPTDTGCLNGVFVPPSCSDSVLTLEVRSPTTYELSAEPCIERLGLHVYASDRTTLLATSRPATGDACFTLRHAFEPGRYVLLLTKTNRSGCSEPGRDAATSGAAGDTTLRLRVVE